MIVNDEIFTVLNKRIEELKYKKDFVIGERSKLYFTGGISELELFKEWLEKNWEPEW